MTSNKRYEELTEASVAAHTEMDKATNIKELTQAASKRGALLAAKNTDAAPELLYSPFHAILDAFTIRLRSMGWAQAVPTDQLGLRLIDCATLADLLHVIHLPLCGSSMPMSQADQRIAYNAVRKLQAALSSLDTGQMETVAKQQERNLEEHTDAELDPGQRYIVVFPEGDRTKLQVVIAWDYDRRRWLRASRLDMFELRKAVDYAKHLAASNMLEYVEFGSDVETYLD